MNTKELEQKIVELEQRVKELESQLMLQPRETHIHYHSPIYVQPYVPIPMPVYHQPHWEPYRVTCGNAVSVSSEITQMVTGTLPYEISVH